MRTCGGRQKNWHGVLTHKDKKEKASAKADEGKAVPWAGKFGMKQA